MIMSMVIYLWQHRLKLSNLFSDFERERFLFLGDKDILNTYYVLLFWLDLYNYLRLLRAHLESLNEAMAKIR